MLLWIFQEFVLLLLIPVFSFSCHLSWNIWLCRIFCTFSDISLFKFPEPYHISFCCRSMVWVELFVLFWNFFRMCWSTYSSPAIALIFPKHPVCSSRNDPRYTGIVFSFIVYSDIFTFRNLLSCWDNLAWMIVNLSSLVLLL